MIWLGYLVGLLSLGVSLLTGCDTSREEDDLTAGDSRLNIVIQTAAIGSTRQAVDPLAISSLQIEVTGPELPIPVMAIVTQIIGPEVEVELVVPQGPDRQIHVDVFNSFTAMIYNGKTMVDLFLPEHDVALTLTPIPSVNPLLETQVNAVSGGVFAAASTAAGLTELTVNIPPGALANDTLLTVGTRNHSYLLPPLPNGVIPIGPVLGFESGGAPLLNPILLTIPYDPAQLVPLGVMENALRFYSLPNGTPPWTAAIPISIDSNTAMLTVQIDVFGSGVIGVMGP